MIFLLVCTFGSFFWLQTSVMAGTAAVATEDESRAAAPELGKDWQDLDAAKSEALESLAEGFSLWWILIFFFLAIGLMLWLVWQNRNGLAFMKTGGEPIDILGRRMLGSKHGVICIRVREREFLLGISGDTITLLSEWRSRPKDPAAEKEAT